MWLLKAQQHEFLTSVHFLIIIIFFFNLKLPKYVQIVATWSWLGLAFLMFINWRDVHHRPLPKGSWRKVIITPAIMQLFFKHSFNKNYWQHSGNIPAVALHSPALLSLRTGRINPPYHYKPLIDSLSTVFRWWQKYLLWQLLGNSSALTV